MCVCVRWNESFPERLLLNGEVALMAPSNFNNLISPLALHNSDIQSVTAPASLDIAVTRAYWERSTVEQERSTGLRENTVDMNGNACLRCLRLANLFCECD